MKTICILNPTAGRGKTEEKWKNCREILNRRGVEVTTVVTSRSGDAAKLAQAAVSEGFETIIVAGGDGTINEVIRSVADTKVNVAIAPLGTGNDLARGMGLPLDELKWAQSFSSLRSIKIDLGVVNGHHFANQAGFGFDAQVAQKINSGIGFLRGKVAYLAAIAICLRSFEAVDVEITVDGNVMQKRVLLTSFANSPFVGGGLMTAPMANPCDGYLDLFILEAISRREFLKSFPLILRGAHVNHPAVSFYKGKIFSVCAASKQYVHVDGEIHEADKLEVMVKPKCLNLLVPPECLTTFQS